VATVADAASAAQGEGRRLVVVQVCGVSHDVLAEALGRGDMPGLGQLLALGRFRLYRIPGSLPTSTPAYQAAVMYGGPVDVPGFEFLEKRTGTYRWFPRPWDAAAVEARHADGHRGILAGGRAYGAVFSGGAEDTVLTFARLLRLEPLWGRLGLRARLRPGLAFARVALRMSVLTAWETARWLGAVLRSLAQSRALPSPLPPLRRVAVSGWLRELFTLGATLDLKAGVPALYVNFVDYDVQAHALGPRHPGTRRALRAVDASIGRIASVVDQLPAARYDLYVVSDHGQLPSVPFEAVSGGVSIVDVVVGLVGPDRLSGPAAAVPAAELVVPLRMPLWPFAPTWQKNLAYLEHRLRERNAVWVGGLCIVPAGPNVNVYLTHTTERVLVEAIETRYPGALARLAAHPGIGHVLARDRAGAVCYDRNGVHRISSAPSRTGCLLLDRADRAAVVRGLEDLLAMPSGGDLILLGHDTAMGCVSYLGEPGSHAGPSPEEMYPFVVAPADVTFDFGAVLRPRDLYRCFAAYGGRGTST
jgi:hypothetical protein